LIRKKYYWCLKSLL